MAFGIVLVSAKRALIAIIPSQKLDHAFCRQWIIIKTYTEWFIKRQQEIES
jgi:hypothetical protein